MTDEDKSEDLFLKRIEEVFLEEGLKKKGHTWYRAQKEICIVFNRQKSSWGNAYYMNFGAIFDLQDKKEICRNDCWDVYGRVGGDSDDEEFEAVLDFDNALSFHDRNEILEKKFIPAVKQLLASFSDLESARKFWKHTMGGYLRTQKGIDWLS
jgi:hypothetical protein